MKKLILCALLALCCAGAAAAGETSLLSLSRGQLALGGNYEWYNPDDDVDYGALPFEKEWTVGLYGSWNLITELDLIGFTKYGLDNKFFNSAIGIRYTIWSGAGRGE